MSDEGIVFGQWRLLPRTRTLEVGGDRIVIGSRAVEILLALIEAGGSIVDRDALIARAWPGRTVEETNLTVQISGLRKAFGAEGAEIIVTETGRGYRFGGSLKPATAKARSLVAETQADGRRHGPSLAVLPFADLGTEAGNAPMADGIVENLITCLSRICWFYVLPRNSAFSFRGRHVPHVTLGRELGVGYVVTGTVQHVGARMRVHVNLIETAGGVQEWSDRFDHATDDVFALQDEIVAGIVTGLEPGLQRAEIERLQRRPTESPSAYAVYRRAIACMAPFTRDNCAKALALLEQARAMDPGYALALVGAARCHLWRVSQRFVEDPLAEAAEAIRLLEAALAVARDDPHVLAQVGFIFGYLGHRRDVAMAMVNRAVDLYPNASCTRATAGWVHIYQDDPQTAMAHFEEALRVDPVDPEAGGWIAGLSAAQLMLGHHDAAVRWGERAIAASPEILTAHLAHAAALGIAGRPAEAAVADLLGLDPRFNLADYGSLRSRWSHGRWFPQLIDGLRRAGVPAQPAAEKPTALKLVHRG
ncbi:winged helix-turn-helix domain-containing protein [Vineibacter terrae]|uniref:winged helix-turn-helix domain-containing protein n=1 Tax=Vineibacter terrae TaxID=2586908 RepID=UPI002E3774AC|nr:winged helix-turn-helix domain-containing protein [Vineibacter terrae]HEX2887436.1 winged helix-turn-helix domain-containing protein [Vineibacter terrae]